MTELNVKFQDWSDIITMAKNKIPYDLYCKICGAIWNIGLNDLSLEKQKHEALKTIVKLIEMSAIYDISSSKPTQ